jgi:hypothetical protein
MHTFGNYYGIMQCARETIESATTRRSTRQSSLQRLPLPHSLSLSTLPHPRPRPPPPTSIYLNSGGSRLMCNYALAALVRVPIAPLLLSFPTLVPTPE